MELGDTIRVSLTEDPWYEIDPCSRLVKFAKEYQGKGSARFDLFPQRERSWLKSLCIVMERWWLQLQPKTLNQRVFYTDLGCRRELAD